MLGLLVNSATDTQSLVSVWLLENREEPRVAAAIRLMEQ